METKCINSFRGKYDFLSNFYECRLIYDGIEYTHSEGAFQAQKTFDKTLREKIAKLSASESKKACGKYGLRVDGVLIKINLRPDWEVRKSAIMKDIVYEKFNQNEDLKRKLLETGNALLIEGNHWHDNCWGNCSCDRCKSVEGRNLLGKILMEVREEFRMQEEK